MRYGRLLTWRELAWGCFALPLIVAVVVWVGWCLKYEGYVLIKPGVVEGVDRIVRVERVTEFAAAQDEHGEIGAFVRWARFAPEPPRVAKPPADEIREDAADWRRHHDSPPRRLAARLLDNGADVSTVSTHDAADAEAVASRLSDVLDWVVHEPGERSWGFATVYEGLSDTGEPVTLVTAYLGLGGDSRPYTEASFSGPAAAMSRANLIDSRAYTYDVAGLEPNEWVYQVIVFGAFGVLASGVGSGLLLIFGLWRLLRS